MIKSEKDPYVIEYMKQLELENTLYLREHMKTPRIPYIRVPNQRQRRKRARITNNFPKRRK
jgi:hypothetical protein